MSKPTPQAPGATRTEQDFLGTQQIPAEAYWGVHSARAVENFPISGETVAQWPELIRALAFVKKAAARANAKLGVLDAGHDTKTTSYPLWTIDNALIRYRIIEG